MFESWGGTPLRRKCRHPELTLCPLCPLPASDRILLVSGKSEVLTQLSVWVACRDVMLCPGCLANQKACEGEMVILVFHVQWLMCGPECLGSRSRDSLSDLRGETRGFVFLRVFRVPQ